LISHQVPQEEVLVVEEASVAEEVASAVVEVALEAAEEASVAEEEASAVVEVVSEEAVEAEVEEAVQSLMKPKLLIKVTLCHPQIKARSSERNYEAFIETE
jgi:hypothetical protein